MNTTDTVPEPTSAAVSRPNWQFDEVPPAPARYFCLSFEGYQLEGRLLGDAERGAAWPRLLAIHGARSDYTKLNALLYPLQRQGIGSLSFNLSGHNQASTVGIENTSLGTNLSEALRFASLSATGHDTVFGHSLGGALALKVAQAHGESVNKIILCCPALYPEAAYRRSFGSGFRKEISTPFGFLDSSSLDFLRNFGGELMLIIGEYDGLRSTGFGGTAGTSAGMVTVTGDKSVPLAVNSAIPFEVIDAIQKSLPPDRFTKIVLPGCDHGVSAWLRANPAPAEALARRIAAFMAS